jgi:hypothetical protein
VSDLFGYDDEDGRSPAPGSRGPAADRADGLPSVRAGAGRPSPSYWPCGFVKLTAADRELAQDCAEIMMRRARSTHATDRFGTPSTRSHYLGALGEIGFARWIRFPWRCHPGDTHGKTDVFGYEVRAVGPDVRTLYVKTKGNDRHETEIAATAIIAGRDADDLMTREAGVFILGWITAGELRRLGRLGDPGNRGAPGYFLEDLRKLRQDGWRTP